MKRYAARPLILALSLVLLAMPLSRPAIAQATTTPAVTGTDPEPQGNVTGTDPEPQGSIVKALLAILHKA